MSILQIMGLLIIGIIVLVIGIARKKKWLIIISAVPLIVFLWQIIVLIGISLH